MFDLILFSLALFHSQELFFFCPSAPLPIPSKDRAILPESLSFQSYCRLQPPAWVVGLLWAF
jgi:hypothetical protein